MRKYSIIGHGSLHSIIKEIMPADEYDGYFDDKASEPGCLGKFEDIQPANHSFILGFAAIRNMLTRAKIYSSVVEKGGQFVNAVSPHAYIYKSATIGNGNIILPFSVLGANGRIGNNCVIFSNTTIEHDAQLGDNVNIAPGVSMGGKVTIGNNVFIGVGSNIRDGITIGNNVIIGAGSLVIQDMPDNVIAYGHPAKVFSVNDQFISV